MENFFKLELFSKYRAELMGLAILLIMCFHCNGSLFAFGFVGVELFLALSAMGLFFSLEKDSNKYRFYKKRLVRILPAYFIVSIPFLLYEYSKGDISICYAVKECFQINTIMGYSRFLWFISIILICYILTPFCLKYRNVLLSNFGLIVISIACFVLGPYIIPKIIIQRIPIFLISLRMASYVYEGKSVEITRGVYSFLVFIVLFIFAFFVIEAYWNIPMTYDYILGSIVTIPFFITTIKIIPHLPHLLNKILKFLGTITLEIYLVHELICLPTIYKLLPITVPDVVCYLLSMLLATCLGYLIHRFLNTIRMTIKRI